MSFFANENNKKEHSLWVEKYGEEEANQRMENCKRKHSKNNSGENNPMHGKPSPQGSGNGWSGHYKGLYFRSLKELSFILNYLERFNLQYSSLERKEHQVSYVDWEGKVRNYYGDFLIGGKYFVEIKPKRLQETPSNKAKFEAAKAFCEEKGMKFKLIDPKVNLDQIRELYLSGEVKFLPKYEKKMEEILTKTA